jgi:hypothetical protein
MLLIVLGFFRYIEGSRCIILNVGGIVLKNKWIGIGMMVAVMIGTDILGLTFAKADGREVWSGTIHVGNHMESEFPDLAKIDFVQAVRAALKKVKGKVLKAELENENGFLIYGFGVVTKNKTIVNVKVDAGSGTVLTVDRDHVDHEKGDRDEDRDHRDRKDKD